MALPVGISGGNRIESALKRIADKVGKANVVKVGFLEGADYPSGEPIAYIASIQEWGGKATIPAHTQTVYREVNKKGTAFNQNGRFVKASKANFASDHHVDEYTVVIPSRPFFRTMIKTESPHWGSDLAKILKKNEFDTVRSLALMGVSIENALVKSIRNWSDPPNAPSTVAKKGFNKPLISSGTMMRAVSSEVE
jgi:hypothetical protein